MNSRSNKNNLQRTKSPSGDLGVDLGIILSRIKHDKLFVLTDQNTAKLCLPLLANIPAIKNAGQIVIPANDTNKTLENLAHIWKFLTENGATRHSLLINLGGGMITDIGGFAAATFKRGIKYINIPTTLLGAVDAAVGGKTGINFEGFKNEIEPFIRPNVCSFRLIFSLRSIAKTFFPALPRCSNTHLSTPKQSGKNCSFSMPEMWTTTGSPKLFSVRLA